MEAQVLEVWEQEEAPHCWEEQENWEVVEGEVGAEVHHIEAMVVEEVEVEVEVGAQYIWGVVGVLVAKAQVQEVVEEEVVIMMQGEVALEGGMMFSADWMKCLQQTEVVHECLCCHWGERVGLNKRYLASWVLLGYFWLSCFHLHRV